MGVGRIAISLWCGCLFATDIQHSTAWTLVMVISLNGPAAVGSSTAAAGDLVRADDNPCRIVAEEAAADRHCMRVGCKS